MNKYISFAFVVFAFIASVSCGNGYGNLANLALNSYGNSGSSSSAASAAAAPSNLYSGPSYSLGHHGHPAGHSYAAPARSYSSHKHAHAGKYSVHPAYTAELYPGQQNYQTYHSAPTYSQVALPVVPSAPVAKLYVPAQHSYGGSSYGSPAASYGGY